MTIPTLPIDLLQIDQLRACVRGKVLTPKEDDYDAARRSWNLTIDQHPALIVIPQNTDDVGEAVRFAQAQGLGVAVQATGHGASRAADHSLLIVTSQMTGVRVHPETQTAWVEAGVKWGRVLEEAQAVGLAPLLGSAPHVGAVGYTLGGGMGWLARKYGLAADSVKQFELVTADGTLLRASAAENADLFWALRGGGGSFGMVTGMEIRLYPVTTVYGGNLYYPLHKAKEVFAQYRRWVANAPDELTSSIALKNFPPLPHLPELLHGQSFVMVRACYCGSIEQGEELMKYWLTWQTPLKDDMKAMPFSQVGTISSDPVDPVAGHGSGAWLNNLSDEVADILIRYIVPRNGPALLGAAEIRHAGGAIASVESGSAAYGNREAAYLLQVVGGAPTSEVHEAVRHQIAQLRRGLTPHLHGGVFMNFLGGEEARERTRQGFSPEAYLRLQQLKARYDPQNRFRHSYDIPPAPVQQSPHIPL